jgi:hypothetical protein
MELTGLELYTTKELVDELMRRTTFLGVVVHAEQEQREREWRGQKTFQVHFNENLDTDRACRLLGVVSERMERQLD